MPDEQQVVVGRVVKPHGVRGEVVVESLTDLASRWAPGARLQAGDRELTVVASRPHQGRVLVRFAGVDDRDVAEQLRGRTLHASPVDLSEHDTYFVHELVGMTVLLATPDGEHEVLGEVVAAVELPPSAGYDLLEVRREDGSTFLLPDTDEYVEVGVDDEGTEYLVVVDPPAGLVDGEPLVVTEEP